MAGKIAQNLGMLALSLVVSLGLAEFVLRVVFDPIDFLTPRVVSHPKLGHAIAGGSGGHDAWGFRNARVPERATIVAVGDSQTYGVSAPARETYPVALAEITGVSVYNLALGGYGPVDYEILLDDFGWSLEPEQVVVGFYFGNDLRRGDGGIAAAAITPEDDPRPLGNLRFWLAERSLLYQHVKLVLPAIADALRSPPPPDPRDANRPDRPEDWDWIPFPHDVAGTVLTPGRRFEVLDQREAVNRYGLEKTKQTFATIARACREKTVACFFLLVPTKESVYVEAARSRLSGDALAEVERLVAEEQRVREELVDFFEANALDWIDPLPRMRAVALDRRLYPASFDGHPEGPGYAVIAEVVAEHLGRP